MPNIDSLKAWDRQARRPPRLGVLSVLTVVVLVPGCTLGERSGTEQSLPPVSTRSGIVERTHVPCEQTITEFSPPGPDLNTVDPSFEIVGGVAALRTSRSRAYASQLTAHGIYDDPALRLASKTPLLIRRGAMFEIRVPDTFRDRVALDYSDTGPPSLRTTFGPCESETEWLVFTGYVWLANPECITLEIALPDSTVETARLGLGEPCPDQQPPRGYSDI